jgi:hypothetical protein
MKRALVLLIVFTVTSFSSVFAGTTVSEPDVTVYQDGAPVTPVGVNFGVVGGYVWLRITGENVPVYAAPGGVGRVLYYFRGGYDFVSQRNRIGEWVEINDGEWVHADNTVQVYASYFNGVLIQGEPAVPFGWVLVTHYASAEPGGAPMEGNADYYVQRYQVQSFYNAQVTGDGVRWYDIGGGRWVRQFYVGKVQRVANPGLSGRWVAVDLYEQTLVAYEGNTMVFATLISSGLPGNDTNAGVFRVWARNANGAMSGRESGYGDYRLENVPYAIYFDNDISLHGTYWHNGFGYRQSRGCVNLSISDARWLYEWLGEGGVYVYYSQSY